MEMMVTRHIVHAMKRMIKQLVIANTKRDLKMNTTSFIHKHTHTHTHRLHVCSPDMG